jgi:hypothetical protein
MLTVLQATLEAAALGAFIVAIYAIAGGFQ